MTERVKEKAIAWLDHPNTTRLFKALAIVSIIASLFVGYQQYQLSTCLAAYAEQTNESTAARAGIAADDREAQKEIFHEFAVALSGDPKLTRERIQIALARWEARTEAAEKQRAENPVPPPPSLYCG